jgi:hypothetical protein
MANGSAARSMVIGVAWMYWNVSGVPVTAAVVLNAAKDGMVTVPAAALANSKARSAEAGTGGRSS